MTASGLGVGVGVGVGRARIAGGGMVTELRALIDAAARLARRAPVEELAVSSGLSSGGVRFALERCLETDVTDAQLAALAASVTRTSVVHVVLSANVFTAALRAVVLARAAAPRVFVRPSSRDPFFAAALVAELDDPAVSLVPQIDAREGEIHVYGRDETIASVRRSAAPGVVVHGHGAGMGVALVTREDEADLLADDVVAFDQRGCLSPRIAFVLGVDPRRFAERLHHALDERAAAVPIGRLDDAELVAARQWEGVAEFTGELYRGPGGRVAVGDRVPLAPPGRNVTVTEIPDEAALGARLAEIARWVVAIGSAIPRSPAFPPHARLSPLGAMQRPPLDGPVDRRAR